MRTDSVENRQIHRQQKKPLKLQKSKGKKFLLGMKHSWRLYILLLPALAFVFIFQYVPLYGVQIAFRNYLPTRGFLGSQWVGLKHFIYFMRLPQFWSLIRNTLLISVYSLLWGFPIPIILAILLNEVKVPWFKKVIQNVTYAPYFISTVVIVSMLFNFLSPSNGIVNTLIGKLGMHSIDFMGKKEYFRSLYIASGIWQSTGWSSIIYLGALSGVDQELHEAAEIDGANRLQRIWHINLTCIRPTIVMLLILNMGGILGVGFEKIYLMQNAPNLEISEVISTYVYKIGIQGGKFSYTTAIGLFNSIINFILLLIANKVAQRTTETSLF